MFEIRQENDMLAGTSLVITIDESELDKKALYTLQETKPRFVLPFRARHIDGKIEFIYHATTLCKLQYIMGDCTAKEYIELWRNILCPLLECEDWFMKTMSFMLDAEYLYYDKDKKIVSFIYIPTKRDCSGHEDLKKMAGELVKLIAVTDMVLENKVLRMIMNGFMPRELLNMLNEYSPEMERSVTALPQKVSPSELLPIESSPAKLQPISSPLKELQTKAYAGEPASSIQLDNATSVFEAGNGTLGDIVINMQSDGKERKKRKEKKKSTSKNEKRKKKDAKVSLSMEIGKNEDLLGDAQLNSICEAQLILDNEPFDDATQCINTVDSACMLRLIGSPLLPSSIRIQIDDGEVFSIGRYDATVGRKQSSFEFERKTKAISRRHAVIKRHMGSYSVIDLSSSAGTFLNGQKLPPNTPFELQNGIRISFGTSGADYVWES